ncbi:MAG: hypothetical protein ABIN37_07255 [Burkholderiaceae bacterium]
MQTRHIATFKVSAIGLGCMNLNHAYGVPPGREEAERLLLARGLQPARTRVPVWRASRREYVGGE